MLLLLSLLPVLVAPAVAAATAPNRFTSAPLHATDNSFGAFACTNAVPIIPFPLAGLGGSYSNYTGCAAEPQRCFVAEGNWSFASTSVVKYGTGGWTSGIRAMGFVMQLCPIGYVYTPATGLWALQFGSPDTPDARACAFVQFIDLTDPAVGMKLHLDIGWQSLFNCSDTPFGEEFLLAGFELGTAVMPTCPLRGVIPPAFIQTPIAIFPPVGIDGDESIFAALTADGYTADYGFGVATQTSCALNFTVISHNASSNLTLFEAYMGDPTDGVSGCLTFIRLGRHLAYAERWVGVPDMDASCGHWADPGRLCCWNWTVVWDEPNDGMQTKILFDYFPEGWQPFPPPPSSGAAGGRGVSALGIMAAWSLVAAAVIAVAAVAMVRQ